MPLPGLKPGISSFRHALVLLLLPDILADHLLLHRAYTFRKVVIHPKAIALSLSRKGARV